MVRPGYRNHSIGPMEEDTPSQRSEPMSEDASRSVLIIDDDEDVSALLEALVATSERYAVAGVTGDPDEGMSMAVAGRPDVAVVGSHRETFAAVDLVARLRDASADLCIVLLADLADPITLLDALASGANTVLSSGSGWAELLPALDLLADGGSTGRSGRDLVA
jgi:DNA-binding NarL/FixJ family response regulator